MHELLTSVCVYIYMRLKMYLLYILFHKPPLRVLGLGAGGALGTLLCLSLYITFSTNKPKKKKIKSPNLLKLNEN